MTERGNKASGMASGERPARCGVCGQALGGGEPEELCPRCLLAAALEPGAAAPVDGDPAPSLRYLGDFELRGEIGRGAMGVVFRAWQSTLQREVAVKILLGGTWASEAARQRFLTEARAAAVLRDSRIVSIYEVGEQDDQPYFAMELVDGPNLEVRRQSAPISELQAATWLADLAEAVAYAHESGVVHRDLKPSNVLIDADGLARITDFGLAKIYDSPEVSGPGLTLTGNVLGTPGFIPPERLYGEADDRSGDIYGLGAILYTLLVGEPPHRGESPAETLHETLYGEIEPPRARRPEVPADLEAICLKCLEKKPGRRYESAADLAADLRRFLADEPVTVRPRSSLARWVRRSRKSPWSAFLGGALGVAGLWLGLMFLVDRVGGPQLSDTSSATSERQGELLLREVQQLRRLGERSGALATLRRAATVAPPAAVRREVMAMLEVAEIRHRQEWPVGFVHSLAASRDGRTVAWLAQPGEKGAMVLEGMTVPSGERSFRVVGAKTPSKLLGGSVSRYPAVAVGGGRSAEVFDPVSGRPVRVDLAETDGPWAEHLPWVFHPDGTRLTFHGRDHRLTEWSAAVRRSRDLGVSGHPLTYLEDGRLLYTVRGFLLAIDPTRGTQSSPAPADPVLAVAATGRFALLDAPAGLEVWDLEKRRLLGTIDDRVGGPQHALLSPDGSRVVLGGDDATGWLRVWWVGREGRPTFLEPENGARVVAAQGVLHPTGSLLAARVVEDERPSIVVWDLLSSRLVARLDGQRSARWLQEGRYLLTAGSLREAVVREESSTRVTEGLHLWDVASPPARYRIQIPARVGDPRRPVRQISASSDGRRLAIDDTLWRIETAPPVLRLDGSVEGRAVFDAQGRLWRLDLPYLSDFEETLGAASPQVPTESKPSVVQRLEPEGEGVELRLETPAGRRAPGRVGQPLVQGLALAGSRAFVATWWFGGEGESEPRILGESFEVWSLDRGLRMRKLSHSDNVRCLAVSPDGKWLAVGGQSTDGGLSLWDLAATEKSRDLAHQTLPQAVAWSPDSRFVVSGGPIDTVDLTILDGFRQRSWPAGQDGIQALAVSADGEIVASGGSNGEIVLWRPDGEELVRWAKGEGGVTALAFASDTGFLVSGSEDGTVTLWDLPTVFDRMADLGVGFEGRGSRWGN